MSAVAAGEAIGSAIGVVLAIVLVTSPIWFTWGIVTLIRIQLRINKLRRGEEVGNKRIDRWSIGWHRRAEAQRRKLDEMTGGGLKPPKPSAPVPSFPKAVSALDRVWSEREAMITAPTFVRSAPSVLDSRPEPRGRQKVRTGWRSVPGSPRKRSGKSAAFTYVDTDGVVTDREILNWTIASAYIEGWCADRKAVRTFRLDRIEEWHGHE